MKLLTSEEKARCDRLAVMVVVVGLYASACLVALAVAGPWVMLSVMVGLGLAAFALLWLSLLAMGWGQGEGYFDEGGRWVDTR